MSASAETIVQEHHGRAWGVVDGGTAVGPSVTFTCASANITVTALWDDIEGVGVIIDAPDDLIPTSVALMVANAVRGLSTLPPPRGRNIRAVPGADATD